MTIKDQLNDIYLDAYDFYPIVVIAAVANRIERLLEAGSIAFPEGIDTLDFDSLMELVRWFERHAHENDALAIWFDDGCSGVVYI